MDDNHQLLFVSSKHQIKIILASVSNPFLVEKRKLSFVIHIILNGFKRFFRTTSKGKSYHSARSTVN